MLGGLEASHAVASILPHARLPEEVGCAGLRQGAHDERRCVYQQVGGEHRVWFRIQMTRRRTRTPISRAWR